MGTSSIYHQEFTRLSSLAEKFFTVRKKTEELCLPLDLEDYNLSVTEDTSPPKWHLAHTSWFFERFLLEKFKHNYEVYRPEFGFLFNSYYRKTGKFLAKNKRNILSRPSAEDIYKYRTSITDAVMEFIRHLPNEQEDNVLKILELGIHHEQQHQELLLMDIKRNFFENPTRPRYNNGVNRTGEVYESEWRTFHAGLVKIGIPANYQSFAFDNEKDQHQVWIDNFQISSNLISNDEFLAFIDEGGYENPQLWLSDGWEIKEKEQWHAPLYWERNGQDWWVMTLGGMIPLELSAPVVHISYYEAQAFARWKKCRLPTEAEWETAARLENRNGQFLENSSLEPTSGNEDHEIFAQIHGTVWEWTQSAYLPYPRYKALGFGLSEYNGKFMCNQFVLRGGSCITPESSYRVTYRNFYYPHMRWMYGGIRLAKDIS